MHIKESTDVDAPVSGIDVPRHLFLLSAVLALFVPFSARLVGVPAYGWEWFTDYASDVNSLLFLSALNMAPALALFVAGRMSRHSPLGYWFAVAAFVGFAVWTHGAVDVRSSSTAGIALLFIPIYAAVVGVLGWGMGTFVHVMVRNERVRDWMAPVALAFAVAAGIAGSIVESHFVEQRHGRYSGIHSAGSVGGEGRGKSLGGEGRRRSTSETAAESSKWTKPPVLSPHTPLASPTSNFRLLPYTRRSAVSWTL